MHTLIIGAGALGGYFGFKMAKAAESVTFYDTDQEKVDILNECGITVHSLTDGEDRNLKIPAISIIEDVAEVPDLVLVLVKSYNTDRAAREISLVKGKHTNVLTLQNGLGNVEKLSPYIKQNRLFAGITYQAAFEPRLGYINHAATGMTLIAAQDAAFNNTAMDLARLLNNCELPSGATTDIEPIRWKKLIVNSVINPLSAIYRLPNGMLPKNPDIVRDMMKLVAEGVAVAQKVGIPLNYGEMWATVLNACRSTANNRSSMLSDVEAGRMTEIQAINGSIVRLGEQYGIETPTHIQMVRQVVAIHGKGKEKFR